ncbi:MAG TPA: hypothetical protein VM580_30290, partial [Labilithrix sp.]|nr:hypothetical protein [Labilithrix sp.]
HNQCSPPGAVCKIDKEACGVNNRCCEPVEFADGGKVPSNFCQNNPDNCCGKDALGIPRCRANFLECDKPLPPNTVCASSADCCGNPCIDNKCATTECAPRGSACTIAADCCAGLPCTIPAGSTDGVCGGSVLPDGGVTDAGTSTPGNLPDGGTCALYGQLCSGNADCCSGVPCTSGRCRYP